MAEINQKIVSCPNGHYYDANRYSSCPICSKGSFSPTIDPFAPNSTSDSTIPPVNNHTIAPDSVPGVQVGGGHTGSFTPTIDPHVMNRASDRMSHTQFVDDSTPAGAPTPVVGWLVAVSGPCRGNDYRIHTGYNNIGREVGDIIIHGDNTISAEKDASITYVYQTRRFYIAHEQGKNVLLLNDIPVLGNGVELHSYDKLTIGSTELMFIGLCGEQFSWNDKEQSNG